jgi:hypothetical protein
MIKRVKPQKGRIDPFFFLSATVCRVRPPGGKMTKTLQKQRSPIAFAAAGFYNPLLQNRVTLKKNLGSTVKRVQTRPRTGGLSPLLHHKYT